MERCAAGVVRESEPDHIDHDVFDGDSIRIGVEDAGGHSVSLRYFFLAQPFGATTVEECTEWDDLAARRRASIHGDTSCKGKCSMETVS